MSATNKSTENLSFNQLSFPAEWITEKPREVERLLSAMSVEEQALSVMRCPEELKQNLLLLSEKALEVVNLIPPEEIYQMIKVIGEDDALTILSLVNEDQLQFIFDLEWWIGDKFQPKRALDWVDLLNKCDEPKTLEWFMTEEFDQKVMLMQALLKVYKQDEMTDSYEGTEGLPHYSPDGVYDIYFTTQNYEPVKKASHAPGVRPSIGLLFSHGGGHLVSLDSNGGKSLPVEKLPHLPTRHSRDGRSDRDLQPARPRILEPKSPRSLELSGCGSLPASAAIFISPCGLNQFSGAIPIPGAGPEAPGRNSLGAHVPGK